MERSIFYTLEAYNSKSQSTHFTYSEDEMLFHGFFTPLYCNVILTIDGTLLTQKQFMTVRQETILRLSEKFSCKGLVVL